MDATKLAASVRSGEKSAAEVAEETLARIEAQDSTINAFTALNGELEEQAQAIDAAVAAGESVGPLAGVPVAVKDNIVTKGLTTTAASRMLEGWIPPYDATVITALVNAGALVIGKTNLDEYGMGSSTENSIFGPTKNPLDPTKVAGGSSGGSAAAVASGMVPLALGSDTGGSTRQPAAFCGLVGVKPTYGRVSRYGLVALASSLDQIGPMAATVADAALLLEAISGHDPLDTTSYNTPVPAFSDNLDEGVDGLRIGLVSELMGQEIDSEIVERTQTAAQALREAGAQVEEVSIPSWSLGVSVYQFLMSGEASSNLARLDGVRYGLQVSGATSAEMMAASRSAGFSNEVKRRLLLGTYVLSAGHYEDYYEKAQRARTLIINETLDAFGHFDLLLSPTTTSVAFRLGEDRDPKERYISDMCSVPANLTGAPAVTVPFGRNREGLPIGVQLIGNSYQEHTMLVAARTLEATNE